MDKKQTYWGFLILIAILLIAQVRDAAGLSSGTISYGLDDNGLAVTSSVGTSVGIYLKDITSVAYVEEWERGEAVEAVQQRDISCGSFRNDAYGEYVLFAYDKNTTYVVVEHTGGVLVFNGVDSRATKDIYEKLLPYSQD